LTTSRPPSHRSRVRHGERGAVLLEFAIIAPIFFLLLFGIIDFGFTFNDMQSVRQGAREGARGAVVKDYGTDTSCGINGSAAGAIDDVKKIICQTKERAALGDTLRVSVRVDAVAPAGFKNNSVKVCVTRMASSVTGMFSPLLANKPLRSEIEMRAERSMGPVVDLGGTWSETDPSGANWSWC
jgi:Flp pilus assembly protein TadG